MIIPAAMMGLPWNQTVLISFKRTLQTLITRSLFSSVSSTITLVYIIKLTTEVITTASQSKGKITGNKELEAKKRGRPKAWDTQETKSRLASIFPLISWRDGKCSVNSGAQNNKFNGFPGSLWYAIEKNILTKGGRIVWEKKSCIPVWHMKTGPMSSRPRPFFFSLFPASSKFVQSRWVARYIHFNLGQRQSVRHVTETEIPWEIQSDLIYKALPSFQ